MLQERHALIDTIGDAPACEGRLEETVLLVGAVEDCEVAPLGTLAGLILDVHGHLNGLVAILQYAHKADFIA